MFSYTFAKKTVYLCDIFLQFNTKKFAAGCPRMSYTVIVSLHVLTKMVNFAVFCVETIPAALCGQEIIMKKAS